MTVGKCVARTTVALTMFLLCCTGAAWAGPLLSYKPMDEALEAMRPNDDVAVRYQFVWTAMNFNYYFQPLQSVPTTGFIFYPGGLVDPRSYAPAASAIAAQGFLVVIVGMPFDIAFFGMDRADRIITRHPEIERWAIGGHSLGGVVACGYVQDNAEKIDGLVMWASYPSETFRIDDKDLAALSLYGTNDGLTTLDEIEESRLHLPEGAIFVPIEGGNHTQFGWYGDGELQDGDNPADIGRQDQQDIIIQSTADFLDQL